MMKSFVNSSGHPSLTSSSLGGRAW